MLDKYTQYSIIIILPANTSGQGLLIIIINYFKLQVKPGEPLYAQVNREKKKNRGYEGGNSRGYYDHWSENDTLPHQQQQQPGGGDSWV
jgi:hypothetical protein